MVVSVQQSKHNTDFLGTIGQGLGSIGQALGHGAQQIGDSLSGFGGLVNDASQHGGIPIQHLTQALAPVLGGGNTDPYSALQQNSAERVLAQAADQRQFNAEHYPGDPVSQQGAYRPTLQDFLQQALKMRGDVGSIYDQQINFARQQAAANDGNIKGAYAALVNQIAGQTPQIAGYYDQAKNEISANNAAAQQGVHSAYSAAGNNQNAALDALGIGNASRGYLAANGNAAANNEAQAVSNLIANGTGNLNNNAEHKAIAEDFNTNSATGAGAYGAALRGQLQQQVAQRIMDLQTQQWTARNNQFAQMLGIAQALNQDEFQREQLGSLDQYRQGLIGYKQGMLGVNQQKATSHDLTPQQLLQQVQAMYQAQGVDPSTVDPATYAKLVEQMGRGLNSGGNGIIGPTQ